MRSLHLIFRKALLSAAALVALASVANAATNNYGNIVGPNIMYLNVVEQTNQFPGPAPATLFGAPQLAGDNLDFNPLGFSGSAQNGDFLVQDGLLSIDQIMTNSPLGNISKLTINEGGGWIVVGGPNAATATATLVTGPILVAQLNGVNGPVNVSVNPTYTFSHTQTGAVAFAQGTNSLSFASNGGVGNGSWGITATYDIAAAITAAGLPAGTRVTKLGTLALDNQLVRDTDPNSFSYIDKKFFSISVVTAIPEPSTILLGLMGGVGLVLGSRKMRRAKVA
jgi:hypothetical protein